MAPKSNYSISKYVVVLLFGGIVSIGNILVSTNLQTQNAGSFSSTGRNVLEDHYDVCIVGAGLSGSVLAERYASELKAKVLVMDKRPHIAGNCYDYTDPETKIRISKYGAHLFHTQHNQVRDYVKNFGQWIDYHHKVRGLVNGKYVPIPVNIETVNTLFDLEIKSAEEMQEWLKKEQVPFENPKNSEEVALSRVGKRLYELIFKPYTIKQWNKDPSELGPEVLARIPVRPDFQDGYFMDDFQALPKDGYTAIFEQMLSSPLITVQTNVDYFDVKDKLNCGKLYYSGPIDTYFADTGWPKLEYRSLDFERVVEKTKGTFQPHFVVNHPQDDDDYTRIVEYKHLPGNDKSDYTVYFIERSKDGGEPYYPVPNDENKELFRRYQELAEKEEGVTFVGRLANYKYFNMDEAIKNALDMFEKDTGIAYSTGSVLGFTSDVKRGKVVDKGLVSYAGELDTYQNIPPVPMSATLQAQVDKALTLPVGKPFGLMHKAHPPGNNLIMGLAAYPNNMYTWKVIVGSLRKLGYDGHLIFGVHKDIPKEEEAYLQEMNVTYYAAEFVNCSASIMDVGTDGGAIRGLCSKGLENLKLEWGRFEMNRQWLHDCEECTGWSMVMDTRDILFQQDPFSVLPSPDEAEQDLLFIEEIAPHTNPKPDDPKRAFILGEARYTWRTEPCYGPRHFQSYYYRPVLCSGTVIGTRDGMHRFLSVLVDEFHSNNNKENKMCRSPHNTDQWTMNYLYYNGRFGYYDKTKTLPWGTGPVNTIGHPCINRGNHSQIDLTLFDENNMILNIHEREDSPGRISPAVHQWDRCHKWIRPWLAKHSDMWEP